MTMRKPPWRRRLADFGVAGATGFFVNALTLSLLTRTGAPAMPSEVLAFLVASFITWQINRSTTFADRRRGDVQPAHEWLRYVSCGAGGHFVTLVVFAAASFSGFPPMAALFLGAASAAGFNFFSYFRWVFR